MRKINKPKLKTVECWLILDDGRPVSVSGNEASAHFFSLAYKNKGRVAVIKAVIHYQPPADETCLT